MRWEDEQRSDNVEDRRGMPVSRGMVGGGIGTVILVLVALYFGIDPSVILQSVPDSGPPSVTQQQQKPGADPMSRFRFGRPGRHGKDMARGISQLRENLRGAEACPFHRGRSVRLRLRSGSHGALLLPRGSQGLHRSGFLRGPENPFQGTRRFCPGIRDRP